MSRNYIFSTIFVFVFFVFSGFISVDFKNIFLQEKTSFEMLEKPPEDIVLLFKKACFDCHSNLTNLPWYTKLPPAKWLVLDHVNEGKKHMNLSLWNEYDPETRVSLLNESIEEIESGTMPLKSYTVMHDDANLTEQEKGKITNWIKNQTKKYEDQ